MWVQQQTNEKSIMNFEDGREDELQNWLKSIERFYKTFGWLADSFVLDFFVEEHWSRVPKCWQEFLPTITPAQLGEWLLFEEDAVVPSSSANLTATPNSKAHFETNGRSPWPLGLQAFRVSIKSLSLSRKAFSLQRTLNTLGLDSSSAETSQGKVETFRSTSSFNQIFRRHVKPKKQYEIQILGKIIEKCAETHGVNCVLDIGSGLGHLSRFLSYNCELRMICVDSVETFTASAKKFDTELEKAFKKERASSPMGPELRPAHLTLKLEMGAGNQIPGDLGSFGLVGLHSCGDLGPLILNTMVNSDGSAKFVVSLGCCFMKMSKGCPMSKFVKGKTRLHFSYEALEVACHAIEQYVERLMSHEECQKLKIHCYRATLESIIVDKDPNLRRSGLRSVKNFEEKGFPRYVQEATAGSELPIHFDQEDLESDRVASMLSQWWKVTIFYSLRLMIANVVETGILLDRVLYLRENGCKSTVLPIFDGRISPRNFAVLGFSKRS